MADGCQQVAAQAESKGNADSVAGEDDAARVRADIGFLLEEDGVHAELG